MDAEKRQLPLLPLITCEHLILSERQQLMCRIGNVAGYKINKS